MATNMSKKRKFVADGVFYAELNEVSLSHPRSRDLELSLNCSPARYVPKEHRWEFGLIHYSVDNLFPLVLTLASASDT